MNSFFFCFFYFLNAGGVYLRTLRRSIYSIYIAFIPNPIMVPSLASSRDEKMVKDTHSTPLRSPGMHTRKLCCPFFFFRECTRRTRQYLKLVHFSVFFRLHGSLHRY